MTSPVDDTEPTIWGCLECGSFVERLAADGRCPVCEEGLVVELGGNPTPDKAQALIAWARRDATELIQNWGTIVGGVAGLFAGLVVSLFATQLGAGVIVALLYTGVLGALIGRLAALRVHLLLRPHRKLQPIRDLARRRHVVAGLVGWLLLLAMTAVALAIFGNGGGWASAGRRLLGTLWAALSGT